MTLDFQPTALEGVFEVETDPRLDERGSFARLYCEDELRAVAPDFRVAQSNLSVNRSRGTVRGLHFQRPPFEEAKLMCCVRGSIWAVALDLREANPGSHHGTEISATNGRLLLVPRGTANGFQTLEDDTVVLYFMSQPYEPDSAAGYHPKSCGIEWPIEIREISDRDLAWPEFQS